MDLAQVATCFAVVFVAELPDKTALASLVLGTRYRPLFVFAGVAAAFAVHVVLAVGAGSLLLLLPHRAVEAVVAVLFAAGAVLMLRRREEARPRAGAGRNRYPAAASRRRTFRRRRPWTRGGVATLTRHRGARGHARDGVSSPGLGRWPGAASRCCSRRSSAT